MGLLDRIRDGTYVPDHDPPRVFGGRRTSLADTAGRFLGGEELMIAVRDFLDQVGSLSDEEFERLIRDEPQPTGSDRADALLAGLAEHFSATRGLRCPAWTQQPRRLLDQFWFVSSVPGFRATALAQTPIALKRRGILWPERSMKRV